MPIIYKSHIYDWWLPALKAQCNVVHEQNDMYKMLLYDILKAIWPRKAMDIVLPHVKLTPVGGKDLCLKQEVVCIIQLYMSWVSSLDFS
jgi:hypothetical protein